MLVTCCSFQLLQLLVAMAFIAIVFITGCAPHSQAFQQGAKLCYVQFHVSEHCSHCVNPCLMIQFCFWFMALAIVSSSNAQLLL